MHLVAVDVEIGIEKEGHTPSTMHFNHMSSQSACVEALPLSVTIFEDRDFKEVIRVK